MRSIEHTYESASHFWVGAVGGGGVGAQVRASQVSSEVVPVASLTASCAVSPVRRRQSAVVTRRVPSGPAVPPQAQVRPQYHLTRRGRVVVALGSVVAAFVLLAALVAVFVGPGATPAAASGDRSVHATGSVVVVQPGQTLWSIALRVAPTLDPRETVTALRQVNNLTSPALFAGQHLIIPTGL